MVTVNKRPEGLSNQSQALGTNFEGAFHEALETVGERYGIYDSMTKTGPVTAQELAGFTNLCQSHITMWLEGQASGGWLYYSAPADRYSLWCIWPSKSAKVSH